MIRRRLILLGACAALLLPARAAVTNAWSDDEFLNELQRRSCQFFLKETAPATGLVPDRAGADGSWCENVASIAATGFGLAALCIGTEHGWIARTAAVARVVTTLQFARDRLAQEHGFFYHFVNREMGDRMWGCEVSPMDTALFLAGALTARQYFADPVISQLAAALYARVDLALDAGWRRNVAAGLETGNWLRPATLGRLCGAHGDVSAGAGCAGAGVAGQLLGRLAARAGGPLCRVDLSPTRAAVRPPIFARLRGFPRPARWLRGLLAQLRTGHARPAATVPGFARQVSALRPGLLGRHRLR